VLPIGQSISTNDNRLLAAPEWIKKRVALDEFAVIGQPVNRVLEVDAADEEVTLSLYDLPRPGPDALQADTPAKPGKRHLSALD
jgi:hypothetical protein